MRVYQSDRTYRRVIYTSLLFTVTVLVGEEPHIFNIIIVYKETIKQINTKYPSNTYPLAME